MILMQDVMRAHLFVLGRVQGVLFRQSAKAKALELGLTGWAHNLLDGKVEIMCEGDEKHVKELIDWCKKGPSLAKVDRVDVSLEEYKGEWKNFEVREFGF
jgi:acylphosphatase